LRILVLTTSFPRYVGDFPGKFIYDLNRQLGIRNEVQVIAPVDYTYNHDSAFDNQECIRFRYLPFKPSKTVVYGDGIASNITKDPHLVLQIPFLLESMFFASVKEAKKSDIIHCNWAITTAVGGLLKRITGRPLVLSVLGSDINEINRSGLYKKAVIRNLKVCDHIVTISDALGGRMIEFGISPEKVTTVPNGVDMDLFKPRSQRISRKKIGIKDRTTLIFVGVLRKEKGLFELFSAFKRIYKKHDIQLVIVGSGDIESNLKKMIEKWKLEDRVFLVGKIDNRMIPDYLSASDVFVLPSYSEGRPNVVLEALSSGLPVVSTRVGGIPEIVDQEETGLLCRPRDTDSLTEAIEKMIMNPDTLAEMKRKARISIKENGLTWENSAIQYEQIFSRYVQ